MQALVEVILPVFLVLAFGYLARWMEWFTDEWVEGLMRFTQGFAFPCLLFRAISGLDLGQSFDAPLLISFYTGALVGFAAGIAGARLLFHRPWEDSIAIGFCGMFSNSLLLGLPIMERAYGAAALTSNYAIVAVHAPFCYAVGVTVMEAVRNRGGSPVTTLLNVSKGMLGNPLVIGILAGFAVNLTGLPVPKVFGDAIDLMVRGALPAALFGLGGVLQRYRPEGDLRTILYVCLLSLILHPAVTYGLGRLIGLSTGQLRSAVVTASMAPGVNAYVFANMYGVAKRVAASSLLFATALSVLTVWMWLALLP